MDTTPKRILNLIMPGVDIRLMSRTRQLNTTSNDLDGKEALELLTADPDGSIGHKLAYYDGTWESTATLSKKTEFTGNSYIFTIIENRKLLIDSTMVEYQNYSLFRVMSSED